MKTFATTIGLSPVARDHMRTVWKKSPYINALLEDRAALVRQALAYLEPIDRALVRLAIKRLSGYRPGWLPEPAAVARWLSTTTTPELGRVKASDWDELVELVASSQQLAHALSVLAVEVARHHRQVGIDLRL